MLLKLWLLGAVVGVYSGRELARRLHYDLRFRYLAAGLRPNFRTINRFRDRHHRDFREVFLQTLKVAQAMGLVKLGQVAVDGTKIRANTSRYKAMVCGRRGSAPGTPPGHITSAACATHSTAPLRSGSSAVILPLSERGFLADNGYRESNLKALERRGQQALIAVRGRKSSRSDAPDLTTALGPATLRERKTQAERPFAEIKARQRFRRFMLRGQEKVMGEWDLVCSGFNDGALPSQMA